MKNWTCLNCGILIREKRFCSKCRLMRFSLKNSPVLDYFGLKLGTLSSGLPFLFPPSILANHMLVSGQTGTGKTRLAMNLIVKAENSAVNQKLKLLIIDVEGEWKNIIPKLKEKTEYYSVDSNLKINPFDLGDPALIRELMRQTVFKGIEKEYVDLSAQMNFVLQETVNESKNMQELIDNIKSYDRQKLTALAKTKTALLVRLDPFMRSPLKEIFMCKKSNPEFDRLDSTNIVIDLHSLDALVAYNTEVRLIYNIITIYFLRKMLNRGTYSWVSNLFVADEAQLLVPKILRKLIITESWPATEFATRLRKRGCGLLLITQSPTNIEQDIFKNTATKISFRLQNQEDIKLLADSVGFTDITEQEYLSNYFVRLATKQAIVCTPGHDPFLITADDFEVVHFSIKPETTKEIVQASPSLDEQTFLESIVREPFISVFERRTSLGWNNKRYSRMVEGLLQSRKIVQIGVKIGRGKPRILYQKPGQLPSVKHEYYVNWILQKLQEKGVFAKKSGVGPDIEIPQLGIAVEVELGTSNMYGNIKQDLQKFDKLIICSDDKKVLDDLSSKIKSEKILVLPIHKVPSFVG